MAGKHDTDKLTESVKQLAKHQGAVLVGVANIERFEPMPPLHDAVPKGHHPKDFLPEAKSVISIAQPILNPAMDAPAFLVDKEMEMIPPHAKYSYLEVFASLTDDFVLRFYNRVAHVVHDYYPLYFRGRTHWLKAVCEGTTPWSPFLRGTAERSEHTPPFPKGAGGISSGL